MKRHILYLAMLALGTAATGCSDDDTAKEGRTEPTTVESISIRTQMAEVSRAQTGDDDPTMGPASTRAGHTMTVTLGSGSERMQATYEYDGGKWIPAGEAVVFPDNKRQPVGIILRKEGTAIQDGTAQGLIDADQLGWDNPAQVPLREMANVPMRHLKTMVEFELGTIAATALTVDGLKACHVGNGNKWQAIIEPSTPGFRVSVTVNNTVSTTEVSAAASPTDGVFLADYRYTVPLVLNGSELTLGTIGVGSWDEGAGGTAQGMTPTHYRIEGLENRTIEVYLAGSDSPTQITLDAKGEAMQQAGVPVGIVARIACDGTQYEIGREESSQISLRIVDGKVAFREADDKGFIPVNTIAELKMIDLDDASRGRKYLQQGNIDLLDAEWTPISKLEGIYDGGNFTVARLRVSLGNGNAGLFAANGGTIRNVVIASASALRGQWHAGMVCGENTGTIERCTNRASVTDGGSNTLGGICGYNNNGTVSECLNTGTLTIDATVPSDGTGGIVGYCGKGDDHGLRQHGRHRRQTQQDGRHRGAGRRLPDRRLLQHGRPRPAVGRRRQQRRHRGAHLQCHAHHALLQYGHRHGRRVAGRGYLRPAQRRGDDQLMLQCGQGGRQVEFGRHRGSKHRRRDHRLPQRRADREPDLGMGRGRRHLRVPQGNHHGLLPHRAGDGRQCHRGDRRRAQFGQHLLLLLERRPGRYPGRRRRQPGRLPMPLLVRRNTR